MDWAVEHLGWTRLVHCIDPANTASIKVAHSDSRHAIQAAGDQYIADLDDAMKQAMNSGRVSMRRDWSATSCACAFSSKGATHRTVNGSVPLLGG